MLFSFQEKKKGKDCYVRRARAHSHRKAGSRLQTAGPLLCPPAVASSRSILPPLHRPGPSPRRRTVQVRPPAVTPSRSIPPAVASSRSVLPPLHRPGPESHAAVGTMIPRRAVQKNPSVSPTSTNSFGHPFGSQEGFLTECAGHPVLCPSSRAGGHLRGRGPRAPSPSPPGIAPAAAISASASRLSPACSPGSLNFVVNKICCFCVSMFMVRH